MPKLLDNHLYESGAPDSLRHLIMYIARAGKYINYHLQVGDLGYLDTQNKSGEKQRALDVVANDVIMQNLEICRLVSAAASEEEESIKQCEHDEEHGEYSVAFDPLDGSSLVDANLAIGSVLGIYKGKGFVGRTGREQVAAIYMLYGPRTTLVYSVGKGTHEFRLNDVGEYTLTREKLNVQETTKYFAPGNLRAVTSDDKYRNLVNAWMDDTYTLRYSGGMVPDVNHILMKGEGVFTYPAFMPKYPQGKLRLLFECAPMAYLMEQAGGAADTGNGPVLDVKAEELHQRTPIFIGSKKEVQRVIEMLK